jgi:Flp pilus assembly pilin Flp
MNKNRETLVINFFSDKSGFSAIAYALIAAFAMTAIIGSFGLLVLSLGTGQAEFPSLSGLLGRL